MSSLPCGGAEWIMILQSIKRQVKDRLHRRGLYWRRLSNGSGEDVTLLCRSGAEVQLRWMRCSPLGTLLGLRGNSIRTVLDIGAHHGQFARHVFNALPEARIFSFEPLPEAFKRLKQWADGFTVPRVQPFNIALGEREAELEMYECMEATDSSSLLPASQDLCKNAPTLGRRRAVKVKVEGLDALLLKEGITLEADILIKIDVEGYEERVLKGAARTLSKAKACMLEVLFNSHYVGQSSFEALSDHLRAFGYRYAGSVYQAYTSDGHVDFADAIFVR